MPLEQDRIRITRQEYPLTQVNRWLKTHLAAIGRETPLSWAPFRRTHGTCTTYWAPCGNGRRTAGTSRMLEHQPMGRPGYQVTAPGACSEVVHGWGPTNPRSSGYPAAAILTPQSSMVIQTQVQDFASPRTIDAAVHTISERLQVARIGLAG